MPETVLDVLAATAARFPDRPALRAKVAGTWQTTTWKDYHAQALLAGRGFLRLGLAPGQGVAILAANRPEWFLAAAGAIAAGGRPAGIYVTSTPEQARYVVEHSDAAVLVVENAAALDRIRAASGGSAPSTATVVLDGNAGADALSWRGLLELGAAGGDGSEKLLRQRLAAQKPADVCTLIYTSGTTGPPKGVMLTHRNLVWTARVIASYLGMRPEDDLLSYLPLSHIAEQILSFHSVMAEGGCTWFAESLERLGETLREVRPHVFFGVPRVWEKMQAGIRAAGAARPALARRIAAWARGVGLRGGYADQRGGSRPLLYPVADRLVFRKVKARLGLDRARVCATSAAPIALDTLEFFLSLGIPLCEVYGMSECTGPTTMSLPDHYRSGRAGSAVPGTALRIAPDGEILIGGPHVFAGYHKDPQATAETLDAEGWVHSGDVGELDAEGYLQVTDRKKELLITSGGKNIGPQILEGRLKQITVVAQAVVVGDRRHYLAALLTLDPARLEEEAVAAGSPARDTAAAATCPLFRAHLERQIEAINDTLARYETIKRFAILPAELTVENDELTPTLKLKRRVIAARYAREIDGLYTG